MECSNTKNIKTARNFDLINVINSYVLKNEIKGYKKQAFELYDLFFAKIDAMLQKNKITDVVVLPDMSWSGLNFDFCKPILLLQLLFFSRP